jgi:formylglycine-generating enzyme required for sulfatase activity
MSTVPQWSGREVRALREARRMSVREFATHLGVSDRMVSKWEASGEAIRPRPMNQAALDTSLAMATPEARTRFNQLAGARTVHIESARPAAGIRHLVRHPIDGKLMTLVESGAFTAEGEDPVWLPAYYIDVLPTTSLDYSRFVAATGHRPPAQWPGGRYLESLADSLIQVSSSDAQAYATWASKTLPTPVQWDRAAGGNEGMVAGHLAEWCTSVRGPRRHERRPGGRGGHTGFRCALPAPDMLALLAI